MGDGSTTYVGLDVHKATIVVARLAADSSAPEVWSLPNEPRAIHRLASKLKREASGRVSCVYEAGVCGYALQRLLGKEGISCEVVAPSLVPRKPGERIKTDRRDAKKLAELWRAGLLTVVTAPSAEQEAVRDLVRCREDVRAELLRARHRLSKMLLRRALVLHGTRNWTRSHREWLRGLRFEQASDEFVFTEYLMAVEWLEARLAVLDQKLSEAAELEPYREPVGWLRCFRGIDTITALSVVAELHGIERFGSPRQLMSFVGLVPGEYSSGESQRRTGLTKAGNAHLRRVLIETAWHYRHRPGVGAGLRKRRQGQPAAVLLLADRAQRRLHQRYQRLAIGLGKPTPKVIAAVARELTGFLWAALHLTPAAAHS